MDPGQTGTMLGVGDVWVGMRAVGKHLLSRGELGMAMRVMQGANGPGFHLGPGVPGSTVSC